jgi:hypothetical protein
VRLALTVSVPLIVAVALAASVMLTLVPSVRESPLATVKSVPALPPSVNVMLVVWASVIVPWEIVSELYETLAGIVENVIVPAVLKTISSPVTGAVPPQFEAVVQFFPVPVPPAHVLVAALTVDAPISVTRAMLMKERTNVVTDFFIVAPEGNDNAGSNTFSRIVSFLLCVSRDDLRAVALQGICCAKAGGK